MSYRELRDFVEIMKALGFKQLISVENFRVPNFYLMADVLFWLVHRYDDTVELNPDISTPDLRISFLKAVAQFMSSKAQVRLNIKQLYRADGYAVKELLKICRILYNAVQASPNEGSVTTTTTMDKLDELKEAKHLAKEIIESGGKLSNLLAHEEKLKKSRDRALKFLDSISLNLDRDSHDQIERNIRQELNLVTERIAEYEKLVGDLQADERTLKVKIDKKKRALIGIEKRLRSLKKVRPDYMEDYEQLEAELKQLYSVYLERFRNLHYLESQLDKHHQQQMEQKLETDRQLKRMQRRWRASEEGTLIGDNPDNDLWSDDEEKRLRPGGRAGRPGQRGPSIRPKRGIPRGPADSPSDTDDDDDSDLESDDAPAPKRGPRNPVPADDRGASEESDEYEGSSEYDEEEDESLYEEDDEDSEGDGEGFV